MFKIDYNRNMYATVAIIATASVLFYLFGILFAGSHPSTPSVSYYKSDSVSDCSWLIFTDGIKTYAKNCNTGVITYNGTDAATVIQNATNSMSNGGLIFIKHGKYMITKTINLRHGITLEGESPSQAVTGSSGGTHLKLANGADVDMLAYNGANLAYFFTFRDIFLDGNKGHNSSGNGIHLNNKANDVLVENVYIDGFAQHGLNFDKVWNYRIIGDILEHNVLDGMFVKAGSHIAIVGSKFLTNGQYGAEFGTDNGGIDAVMMSDNYIQENHKIGVRLVNSQGADIIGNVFQINSDGNPGLYPQLQLDHSCTYSKVEGNQFIGSSMAKYAIAISDGLSKNVIIIGNGMQGHTASQPIMDLGTNTIIQDNGGYVTENAGTGIIFNGTTSVIIRHGLSYIPTAAEIFITRTNSPTNDPGNVWISNITSTQFTVNVRKDPGASGMAFSWAVRRI